MFFVCIEQSLLASTVPINHVNLYDFATCPGYGRYFISPIVGVWSGDQRGYYIKKWGTGAHDGRTAGTAGPKWDGGRPTCGYSGQAEGDGIFPLVGDARPYRGAYQEGTGVRQETEKVVRLGTFNIRNGRNGGI